MSFPMADPLLVKQLDNVRMLADAGNVIQAELLGLKLIDRWPACAEAHALIARFAAARDDLDRAVTYGEQAHSLAPGNQAFLFELAWLLAAQGDDPGALQHLQRAAKSGLSAEGWLLLGHLLDRQGEPFRALKAWFRAVDQAQGRGHWLNEASTPPALLPMVLQAMEHLRPGRRSLFTASLEEVRRQVGAGELVRVDRALAQHLGEVEAQAPDPRQRPKFFHFPGLPAGPYHDPFLQPWAGLLQAAFTEIRAEAIELLGDRGAFESFLSFGPGARTEDYVAGDGKKPSWDAFFFHRHGTRFDEHHLRCPKTSAVLESVELCRVKAQAPEVCFSLLAPGSHIKPHFGVTNTRMVLHLPLVVPRDCALNIVGAGEHHWKEGQLMMFDDTYQHEAWNRSDNPRLILLMDCWNPYLTDAEKLAVTALVECISDFENVF